MHADDAYVLKALKSGACGYVLKDSDSTDLIRAIRRAIDGRRYLSSPLSERAMDAYVQKAQSSSITPFDLLTPREQEVLQMTAEGLTSSQIAERLFISPRTVEKHRSNLMSKLGLHRQSEVVRYAVEHGMTLSIEPRQFDGGEDPSGP
jgi:DNA-binding NarL/FixJ family response regulator